MQKTRSQGKRAQANKPRIWVARANTDRSFGAVFEDDGKAGLFYLCSMKPMEIITHVQIYHVDDLPLPIHEDHIQIFWAEHGKRAALSIRGWPLAVFDIPSRNGWLLPELPEEASEKQRQEALADALAVE
jgi:hypothetical protein